MSVTSSGKQQLNIKKLEKITICENASDFCRNTSLHGFKFMGNPKITNFERFFFVISFILALALAIYYISNVYMKWSATPIIISISPVPTFIENVPFPAITICNMNQASAKRVKNVSQSSLDYSFLQTLCYRQVNTFNGPNSNKSYDWRLFTNFIMKSSQRCDELLLSCQFGSISANCSDLFRPVLTDEGLCCTFNTVQSALMFKDASGRELFPGTYRPRNIYPVNWTPEKGYPAQLPRPYYYPFPGPGTGSASGLRLIVNAETDDYYCSSTNGAGFKLLLHSPIETPKISEYGIPIQVGYESRIVTTPRMAEASDYLTSMRKEYRQCVYDNEGELTYYSTYSRKNCEMECEARMLMKICNCVKYFMPRILPNLTICGIRDYNCTETVRLQALDPNSTSDCSDICSSPCFELNFEPTSFAQPILKTNFYIRSNILQNMSQEFITKNIGIINIYYMERVFRSFTKEQFIGFTEFLSNTGGLMSLFLGFSVVSLIEIIYYFSIRPCCAVRRYRQKLHEVEDRIQNTKPPNTGKSKLALNRRRSSEKRKPEVFIVKPVQSAEPKTIASLSGTRKYHRSLGFPRDSNNRTREPNYLAYLD